MTFGFPTLYHAGRSVVGVAVAPEQRVGDGVRIEPGLELVDHKREQVSEKMPADLRFYLLRGGDSNSRPSA